MMKRILFLALTGAAIGVLRGATLADNVAAVDSARAAISNAISAKGVSAPFALTQMSNAVMQIEQGGGSEYSHGYVGWDPPADWPNIREILKVDPAPYAYKIIILYYGGCTSVSLTGATAYSTDGGTNFVTGTVSNTSGKPFHVTYYSNSAEMNPNTNVQTWPYYAWIVGSEGAWIISNTFRLLTIQSIEANVHLTGTYYSFILSNDSVGIPHFRGNMKSDYILTPPPSRNAYCEEYQCASDMTVSFLFRACYFDAAPNGLNYTGCGCVRGTFNESVYYAQNLNFLKDVQIYSTDSGLFRRASMTTNLPDNVDLCANTSNANSFNSCVRTLNIPRNLKANYSVTFADCKSVSDRDSVAQFDAGGNIVGGMVYNLQSWDGVSTNAAGERVYIDVCPNSGQTITFNSSIKALFTETERTAIADALTAKNWGVAW